MGPSAASLIAVKEHWSKHASLAGCPVPVRAALLDVGSSSSSSSSGGGGTSGACAAAPGRAVVARLLEFRPAHRDVRRLLAAGVALQPADGAELAPLRAALEATSRWDAGARRLLHAGLSWGGAQASVIRRAAHDRAPASDVRRRAHRERHR